MGKCPSESLVRNSIPNLSANEEETEELSRWKGLRLCRWGAEAGIEMVSESLRK